jgi:hypothetical protein
VRPPGQPATTRSKIFIPASPREPCAFDQSRALYLFDQFIAPLLGGDDFRDHFIIPVMVCNVVGSDNASVNHSVKPFLMAR